MQVLQKQKELHLQYDKDLNLSFGKGQTEKKWKNETRKWSDFLGMLAFPIITHLTQQEYTKLPKSEKSRIKDVGAYVGGFLKEGKRTADHVQCRSILTLDVDYATMDFLDDLQLVFEHAYAVHSTHSHTKEAPRFRLIIPLSRPISVEEYEPLARKVAQTIGMDFFDDTTYQAERLMHKPAHPKDGDYVFEYQDSVWLNPDDVLCEYEDWRDSSYWPESSRSSGIRERQAKKQGDPTEKPGWIGAFCRAYDIRSAIETFLAEVYEPTGKDDRYTYTEGSTSGGLVLYDDKFAYSHHSTDPVGDKLCNAFDLVRIHKFGKLDEKKRKKDDVTKLPSYKAMMEFAMNDKRTKIEHFQTRQREAFSDFSFVLEEEGEEEDNAWMAQLRYNTTQGTIKQSIYNAFLFLEHERNLKRILISNLFTRGIERTRPFPWTKPGTPKNVTDDDVSMLRAYLDQHYNFQISENLLRVAIIQSSKERDYHPVKDYIEKERWDGIKRAETLFIDYLGAEDNEYSRAVTRKWLAGAVARIYQPGVKFEMFPVFSGAQGIGKSTILYKLAPEFFNDSLMSMGQTKDDSQLLIGTWIVEIGELSAMRKSEIDRAKDFVSRRKDILRLPFAKEPEEFPRTCVFAGTTNHDTYLKDETGNRRFFPLKCSEDRQKQTPFDGTLEVIVPQIWAEAKHYYEQGEKLYLEGELKKYAEKMQEEAMVEDLTKGMIMEYLNIPIPKNWYEVSTDTRANYIQDKLKRTQDDYFSTEFSEELMQREVVTSKEVYQECFGKDIKSSLDGRSSIELRKIGRILNNIPGWKKQVIRLPNSKGLTTKGYKRI